MLREADMYGNRIYPIGETGYGVSVAFGGSPSRPLFTVFHASDGFRQSLFSAWIDGGRGAPWTATVGNVFYERVTELMESAPHGPGGQRP